MWKETDVLLVIDVQNDFCPGGKLAVPGGDEVVPLINRLARGFKPLIPDPAANSLVGVAKQLMQISSGNTAGSGNGFRVKVGITKVFSHNGFNTGEMGLTYRGSAGGQRTLVGFQGQHQKIN